MMLFECMDRFGRGRRLTGVIAQTAGSTFFVAVPLSVHAGPKRGLMLGCRSRSRSARYIQLYYGVWPQRKNLCDVAVEARIDCEILSFNHFVHSFAL
jgi:hypothetical protein